LLQIGASLNVLYVVVCNIPGERLVVLVNLDVQNCSNTCRASMTISGKTVAALGDGQTDICNNSTHNQSIASGLRSDGGD
jgi:hypothetical protein